MKLDKKIIEACLIEVKDAKSCRRIYLTTFLQLIPSEILVLTIFHICISEIIF